MKDPSVCTHLGRHWTLQSTSWLTHIRSTVARNGTEPTATGRVVSETPSCDGPQVLWYHTVCLQVPRFPTWGHYWRNTICFPGQITCNGIESDEVNRKTFDFIEMIIDVLKDFEITCSIERTWTHGSELTIVKLFLKCPVLSCSMHWAVGAWWWPLLLSTVVSCDCGRYTHC
jgi:hypothetical protein